MDLITFIKEATVNNQGFVYHAIGGMIIPRLILSIVYTTEKNKAAILGTFIVAVLWEMFEQILAGFTIIGYSNGLAGYIADTLGDIGIAVLVAWSIFKNN